MSSCLNGGGRTYGFELDIVPSPSSARSSSSPSSTLSESSNSPRRISTKRARTPRKRPNQTYTEAAALLSTVYPKVFPAKNLGKLCKHTRPFNSFSESPELLPAFPALYDAEFLIGQPQSDKPVFAVKPKPVNSMHKACWSPPCSEFRQQSCSPGSLDDDGFNAESILDGEIEEGIDSIMGNLIMDNNEKPLDCNAQINPYLRSLMRFGLGVGKLELGFGLGLLRNIMHRRALRQADDGEWWRSPKVIVRETAPKFKTLSSLSAPSEKKKKKKKKKVETEEAKESSTTSTVTATTAASSMESLRSSLLLKLDYLEVVKEWSGRGSPFSEVPDSSSPESTADILARLSEIDLSPEAGSGCAVMREASVIRYKEKRRSRLSLKKIRYQVRKVNADKGPRTKGKFVKSPLLLQEAINEVSQ